MKERRGHLPADMLALLLFPSFVIMGLIVGPQRLWIVLLLIGCCTFAAGCLLFRSSRVRLFGWLYLLLGITAFGAGIYYALIPW